MCGLKQYSGRNAAAVLLKVRQANSDGREQDRYRKSSLTRFDEKRQIHATYGWTQPPPRVAVGRLSPG